MSDLDGDAKFVVSPRNTSGRKSSANKSRNKPGSGKKKRNSALEEVKQQGRRLRSAMKEGDSLEFLMSGLSLEDLQSQSKGVGLVYDDTKMLEFHSLWDADFPERPERLRLSMEKCKEYGLVERCTTIPVRCASEEEILLCHTKEYYERVKSTASMTKEELKDVSSQYDGVNFHPSVYDASMLAAGGCISAVESVCKGEVKHSMALVRPPGHHATESEACGHCFFNNVAIAAKYAVEHLHKKRVLIIDWDVHHGQGIQEEFYDSSKSCTFQFIAMNTGDSGLICVNQTMILLEKGRAQVITSMFL